MDAAIDTVNRRGWLAAVAVLIVAVSTGVWLRFGLIYGFPAGIQFANLRHAHSHLMYFGWVTPALFALIGHHLPRVAPQAHAPRFGLPIALSIGFGLLAYPAFLLYGYQPAAIGDARLPLSVIGAGLNVIGWYVFVWRYWRATRGVARNVPLRLWDGGVLALVAATLGTWGLPVLTLFDIDSTLLSRLFTHIFLDLFSEGWFVLALLGTLYAAHPQVAGDRRLPRALDLVLIGIPFIFLFNMPTSLIGAPLRWLAGGGVALLALGLCLHVAIVWPAADRLWRVPLLFLVLQATVKLVGFVPAGMDWAVRMGLRIPYLHWLLLGWTTLGLFVAAQQAWGRSAAPWLRALVAAVVLHLATLLLLTRLWPAALRGAWAPQAVAWSALLVVLIVAGGLLRGARLQRHARLAHYDRPTPLSAERR